MIVFIYYATYNIYKMGVDSSLTNNWTLSKILPNIQMQHVKSLCFNKYFSNRYIFQ